MERGIGSCGIENAIRNEKLVEVRWSGLTENKRRAANNVLFHIYE